MNYINWKNKYNGVETVDEAKTFKEARYLLKEYSLAYNEGSLYISRRACKNWSNR